MSAHHPPSWRSEDDPVPGRPDQPRGRQHGPGDPQWPDSWADPSRGDTQRGDTQRGDTQRGDSHRGDAHRGDHHGSGRGDHAHGDHGRGDHGRGEPARGTARPPSPGGSDQRPWAADADPWQGPQLRQRPAPVVPDSPWASPTADPRPDPRGEARPDARPDSRPWTMPASADQRARTGPGGESSWAPFPPSPPSPPAPSSAPSPAAESAWTHPPRPGGFGPATPEGFGPPSGFGQPGGIGQPGTHGIGQPGPAAVGTHGVGQPGHHGAGQPGPHGIGQSGAHGAGQPGDAFGQARPAASSGSSQPLTPVPPLGSVGPGHPGHSGAAHSSAAGQPGPAGAYAAFGQPAAAAASTEQTSVLAQPTGAHQQQGPAFPASPPGAPGSHGPTGSFPHQPGFGPPPGPYGPPRHGPHGPGGPGGHGGPNGAGPGGPGRPDQHRDEDWDDEDEDGLEDRIHGHGHAHGRPSKVSARTRRIVFAIVIPCVIATVAGLFLLWPGKVAPPPGDQGNEQRAYGRVTSVSETPCPPSPTGAPAGPTIPNQPCGLAGVHITSGTGSGTDIMVDLPQGPGAPTVKAGDSVVLSYTPAVGAEVPATYQIVDHERGRALIYVLALCGAIVIVFGRLRGFAALIALAVSFVVLLGFILPGILDGKPPLLVAIVGSAAVMFAVLYLTHGVNTQTSVAVLGTLASLVITGLLGVAFTATLKLTGFGSEESVYVSVLQGTVDMRGLLLAGIIIGALGVLDDMTVTQASTVAELAKHARSRMEIYKAATRIGRDHVASAVNTIVFAYAGASLPLLLLLVAGGRHISDLLTSEFITQEIVRTAVGTVGLIAAVPITNVLGSLVADIRPRPADRRSA